MFKFCLVNIRTKTIVCEEKIELTVTMFQILALLFVLNLKNNHWFSYKNFAYSYVLPLTIYVYIIYSMCMTYDQWCYIKSCFFRLLHIVRQWQHISGAFCRAHNRHTFPAVWRLLFECRVSKKCSEKKKYINQGLTSLCTTHLFRLCNIIFTIKIQLSKHSNE